MVAENVEPKEAKKTAKPKAQDEAPVKPAAAPKAQATKPAAKPEVSQAKPAASPVKPAAKPIATSKPVATKTAAPADSAKPAAAKPIPPKAQAAKPAPVAEPKKKTAYQELKELRPEVRSEKAPEAARAAPAPKPVAPEPEPAQKAAKPVAPAPKKEVAPKAKKVKYEAPAKAGDSKDVEIVDEKDDEDDYKAKAKPELSAERRLALHLKDGMNARRPAFHRQEWFRYKKLGDKWRKPKGIHSKMREHLKKRPPVVSIGFRSPKATRDLHPSGFREIMVHNTKEMEFINPKVEAARVAHGVGFAKLMRIVLMADQKGIRLLNISVEKQTLARKKAKEEGVKLPVTGAVE
jgi:large subunit ribosomal protein L32e